MVHTHQRRFVRHIGWLFFGIYLILGITGLILWSINETSFFTNAPPTLTDILFLVALSVWAFVGAMLISLMPTNPFGWIFSITPLLIVLDDFLFGYAYYGFMLQPGSLPGVEIMMIWLYWTSSPFASFGLVLLFVLFPTGKLLSPGWRRLIWICVGAVVFYVLAAAIAPNPFFYTPFPTNLLGIESSVSSVIEPVTLIAYFVVIFCLFTSIGSSFLRLYRSTGVERQQLKWFVFASVLFIPGLTLVFLSFILESSIGPILMVIGYSITLVAEAGIAIAAIIAILRYRLWDIDIIIRRTLVYGLLTGSLALIYFLTVVILQQVLQQVTGQQSPLAIVLSTLVIAALFSPLRMRIQDFIDKRFYRRHYDAVETLAKFALVAQEEVDLEALVEDLLQVVDRTMNPESISLWLKED